MTFLAIQESQVGLGVFFGSFGGRCRFLNLPILHPPQVFMHGGDNDQNGRGDAADAVRRYKRQEHPMSLMSDALLRLAAFFVLIVLLQGAFAYFPLGRETKRRLQHALTGHALVQFSYFLPEAYCKMGISMGAVGIWYTFRFQSEAYLSLFESLLRAEEIEGRRLPGAFYFLLGAGAVLTLFPVDTARYAIECLSFADPFAAFVGQSVESKMITKSSSVAGSAACFVMALLVGFTMLNEFSSIVAGALFCTISEAISCGLNDNLTIPVFTALAVHVSSLISN